MSRLCPNRPVSFLQIGHPGKPGFCAMEFYEAVVGGRRCRPSTAAQSLSPLPHSFSSVTRKQPLNWTGLTMLSFCPRLRSGNLQLDCITEK